MNEFYLIWPFILQKKYRHPLKELKKNFFEIGRTGYQKKRNFALISKMCLEFGKREKKILQKNWIFRDFLRKNLRELLDARVLHIFEISVKFRLFWYRLRTILKKFFFNSYKGWCGFLIV